MPRIDPTRLSHRLAVLLLVLGMARLPLPMSPEQKALARQGQGPILPSGASSVVPGPLSWLFSYTEFGIPSSKLDAGAPAPVEEEVTSPNAETLIDHRGGHSRLVASAPPRELEQLATRPTSFRFQTPVPPPSGERTYISHLSGADGPTYARHSLRA